MAAVDVISKCVKTVKPFFNVSSFTKRNRIYICDCWARSFSSKTQNSETENFDLIVIGGGSGGLSCAKEAKNLNASVCVIDYVSPSPRGNTWGMGGTCVNVGCIPKKLMHQAALIGEAVQEAKFYGWEVKNLDSVTLNWEKLKEAVQNHIKSTNWVVRVMLKGAGIEYINGMGRLVDEHTVEVTIKDKIRRLRGENIVIAVGGRPRYPNIPGAIKYGITSDDIFSLPKPPGKTLIVGAGYIALECAGFLNAFNYPVKLMVRSIVLRSFDRQMADLITEDMLERGVNFIHKSIPKKVEKSGDKLSVTFENVETHAVATEEFDSVLFAIGRKALSEEVNAKGINLDVDEETGKILTENERTCIPHVYALGDILHGKPELTPVAIEAGKLLARRIFGNSEEQMDYDVVPTTIFTPLEYGCVGLSEEKAIKKFGEDNLEVFHSFYKPLEFYLPEKQTAHCYLKVIAERNSPGRILGMHFVGPTAGEVIQGYAAAMKCGFTMHQLMGTVAIHPTVSEEFTRLFITKRSGLDPKPQSCCS